MSHALRLFHMHTVTWVYVKLHFCSFSVQPFLTFYTSGGQSGCCLLYTSMPPECTYDWVKKDYIDKPPIWCSVDLRDGNQALIEPMSLEEKLQFFEMLVKIGFKEIEVGFPAASETEYNFMRALIDRNMIPDDVTVQVLTQAREHIIKKRCV